MSDSEPTEAYTDDDYLDRWEERAAIREFDGRASRQQAEYLAAKDIKAEFGFVPDVVREAVARNREGS